MTWLFFLLCMANDPADLQQEILNLTRDKPGTYAVAYRCPKLGEEVFIEADVSMHAASTMKTPVMMRLFQMVEQGKLTLQQPILIQNTFKSIVDGSEYTLTVDDDDAAGLHRHMGESLPMIRVIEAMIRNSSNLATNILIELADAKQTTALMRELGASQIQVLRGVMDIKAYDRGLSNTSSARDMLTIMLACADSPRFSDKSRETMLDILRHGVYRDMIPAGIPEGSGARIASKTGSISTVQHDTAIVDLPDGTRYGLVIYVQNFGEESNREVVMATARSISRLVYEHVTAQLKR